MNIRNFAAAAALIIALGGGSAIDAAKAVETVNAEGQAVIVVRFVGNGRAGKREQAGVRCEAQDVILPGRNRHRTVERQHSKFPAQVFPGREILRQAGLRQGKCWIRVSQIHKEQAERLQEEKLAKLFLLWQKRGGEILTEEGIEFLKSHSRDRVNKTLHVCLQVVL